MLTFSYTITPSLKSEIERIEELRRKILIQLLPTSEELQLRFEIGVDRAVLGSKLTDEKINRDEVVDGFINKEKSAKHSENVLSYFNAYEWLDKKWFMAKETIKLADIKKLYSYFPAHISLDEKQIEEMLSFIQVNPEHPIVEAGLAVILSSGILPGGINNLKFAMLTGEIFIYKFGFDFRGLLTLEEFIENDIDHFKNIISDSFRARNLSAGLEYYAQAVAIQAERALKKLTSLDLKGDLPSSFFALTERQKEILTLFTKPGVKVTNKTIQKQFNVSQITSSRDLAKLNTLGLIFSGGKGRSVYYTRL